MKKTLLIAAMIIAPSMAQACTGTGAVVGACCSTLGETKMNTDETAVIGCMREAAGSSVLVFKEQGSSAPSGTLAAFNLAACPAGWTAANYAAGRVIVGAGSGAGLTERAFGTTGGEETHTLTTTEIPPHAHTIGARWSDSGAFASPVRQDADRLAAGGINAIFPDRTTSQVGGGQPFNTMPPFIVLTYCQKD